MYNNNIWQVADRHTNNKVKVKAKEIVPTTFKDTQLYHEWEHLSDVCVIKTSTSIFTPVDVTEGP